jgi:membrane-associated phospholipid phosphatase
MGKLTTTLDRVGKLTKRPSIWAATAALLAVGGGQRGQRAALRGGVGYAVAGVIANLLIKPIVQRPRPPEAKESSSGPFASSFPSGHTATDLAFAFSAAQEFPAMFVPLAAGTATAHWSRVRTGSHYISDVFAGGVVGIAVAWAMRKVWPPVRRAGDKKTGAALSAGGP